MINNKQLIQISGNLDIYVTVRKTNVSIDAKWLWNFLICLFYDPTHVLMSERFCV